MRYALFQFNITNRALARCPHCRRVSSVGPSYARSRAILFAVIGLFLIILGIGVTVNPTLNRYKLLQLFF